MKDIVGNVLGVIKEKVNEVGENVKDKIVEVVEVVFVCVDVVYVCGEYIVDSEWVCISDEVFGKVINDDVYLKVEEIKEDVK